MKEEPKRRVTVHIDSLVLKGFRYEDRHAVAQGLQEQLTEMLSAPDMVEGISQTGTIPRLRVAPVNVAADARPKQIGIATANGIGKGFGR